MKFVAPFIFALLLNIATVHGQYTFVGNSSALGNNCYQITSALEFQNGALWYNQSINLTMPFHLQFLANFGSNPDGADGMVFVMQQVSNSVLGQPGEGMGFQGFAPSFGIEFDTYQNLNQGDPVFDHVAFLSNGSVNHTSANNLGGPVQASPLSQNICDGLDHIIDIYWTPNTNLVELWLDCVPRIATTVNLVGNIFQGNPVVFWGFTGATGGSTNLQKICVDPNILGVPSAYEMCAGASVQLQSSGTSMGSYSWTPAAGLSDPGISNPVASPQVTTEYTVTFTDLCQTIQTQNTTVTVHTPAIDLGSDIASCEGQTATVIPQSVSGSITWNNGSTGPQLSVSNSGMVSATATAANCSATDEINVNFSPAPEVELPLAVSICQGESYTVSLPANGITYTWDDGVTGGTRTFNQAGTYTATAALGDCTAQGSIQIITAPLPTFNLGGNQSACDGVIINLSANAGNAVILWDNGISAPTIEVQSAGIYWATAYLNGCSYADTVLVEFKPNPVVSIDGPGEFCEGESVQLSASGATSYNWSAGLTSETISISAGGTYQVVGTNTQTGCTGQAAFTVQRTPLPRITLPETAIKCLGSSITAMAETSVHGSILWNTGSENPFISISEPGIYSVTLSNSCGEITSSIEIMDKDCSNDLFIPNAFTPNGDGLNDLFRASSQNVTSFEMRIFSRFGELVFSTDEIHIGWNGSMMNSSYYCQAGMYAVLYKAQFNSMEIIESTSHLVLIR